MTTPDTLTGPATLARTPIYDTLVAEWNRRAAEPAPPLPIEQVAAAAVESARAAAAVESARASRGKGKGRKRAERPADGD